jgi:hypothetical protein
LTLKPLPRRWHGRAHFRLRVIPNKTSQSSSGRCVASQPVLDLKNFIA